MSSDPNVVPLDDALYRIDDEALVFMQDQTGIQDTEELKRHILDVQAKAYSVHPYSCIRRFTFIQLKLARLPAYQHLLQIGKEREGAIFLDVGCCFGDDIRKAIADGFPTEGAIGSDLLPEFWNLGHELFKTTPESFPVPFVAGDAFNPVHLDVAPPLTAVGASTIATASSLPLTELKSLNPLRGRVSAIHTSSFFHLFGEAEQLRLARALTGLLSPAPGSLILGSHGGRAEKGFRTEIPRHNQRGRAMFCHSPESWAEMWEAEVFGKGMVKVEAVLKESKREDLGEGVRSHVLVWSVTRL